MSKEIRRIIDQAHKAWTQTELDSLCAQKYGATWVWDDNMRCCVDSRTKPTRYMPLERKRIIRIKL